MSDEVIGQEVQDEAAAFADVMAGYEGKARVDETPAEVEIPEIIPETPVPTEPTQVEKLASELENLKAQVRATAADPDTVRRMHGEIGDINRTLKNLQKAAPVDDELTAAMTDAQKVADEFPELAGPLVKVIKALGAARPAPAEQVDISGRVSEEVETRLQKNAIEALQEDHPDYETVRTTPEFLAWEKTKTPEYQQKLRSTWNPAVVSRGLTEFKDSLKALQAVKQKKQDRLASAVVAPSASQQSKPSTLPDEEGLWVGYNSGPKRRIMNR